LWTDLGETTHVILTENNRVKKRIYWAFTLGLQGIGSSNQARSLKTLQVTGEVLKHRVLTENDTLTEEQDSALETETE
jgi:hypothetical protein